MSQQPPRSPYDGPPVPAEPVNPYGPAYPHPAVPDTARPGLTNTAKFWIGFVLSLPVGFIALMVIGAGNAAGEAIADDTALGGVFSGVLALAILFGLVTGIVVEKTRRFALGLLAGTVLLLILAIAAVVVFLIALANAFT